MELALAFVEDRSAERPLAFCVRSSAGPDLLLAASAKSEYAAWIHAVRFGAPAFRTAVVVVHIKHEDWDRGRGRGWGRARGRARGRGQRRAGTGAGGRASGAHYGAGFTPTDRGCRDIIAVRR